MRPSSHSVIKFLATRTHVVFGALLFVLFIGYHTSYKTLLQSTTKLGTVVTTGGLRPNAHVPSEPTNPFEPEASSTKVREDPQVTAPETHVRVQTIPTTTYNTDPAADSELSIPLGGELFKSDDLMETSGFPTKPVSLEQLKFCSPMNQYRMKEIHRCETDDTCKGCFGKYITENKKLRDAFQTQVMDKQPFIDLVNKMMETEVVVISSTNIGQFYLLLNWYRSVKKNTKLNPCEFTFLMVTDQKAFDLVKKYTCIPAMFVQMEGIHISERYITSAANILGHSKINNLILYVTNHFVQQDKIVLLHDVDNVWLQDPFRELKMVTTGVDTTCMYSPYMTTAKGVCNTGFIYVKPNKKSKVFWGTLMNTMDIKKASDQALFDQLITHRMFRMYYVRPLSPITFAKRGQSKFLDKKKTLVYHAVGPNKAEALREKGLWYLTEEEDKAYIPSQ